MKQYYIPYFPGVKKFDYLPVLCFWLIAGYNKETKLFDTITFQNLDGLAGCIETTAGEKVLSKSTLSRVLNNEAYKDCFTYDRQRKEIILKNNFRSKPGAKENQCFVVVSAPEISYLVRSQDSLLIQYFLYLRYYCGLSKSKTTDTTAKQFLSACGYCETSNNYLSKIAGYNRTLSAIGFISIKKSRDTNGRERNEYRC